MASLDIGIVDPEQQERLDAKARYAFRTDQGRILAIGLCLPRLLVITAAVERDLKLTGILVSDRTHFGDDDWHLLSDGGPTAYRAGQRITILVDMS